LPASERRRAVILMVVLVLLTLFAVVGLAFVLYSNAEADNALANKQTPGSGLVPTQPNEQYQSLLNAVLQQLIFDVPDPAGVFDPTIRRVTPPFPDGPGSALRGQSLGRNLYGWNSDVVPAVLIPGGPMQPPRLLSRTYPYNGSGLASNIYPFSGVGRLH